RTERNLDVDAISLADFKKTIREQARIMRLDAAAAVAALPELLSRAEPADIHEMSGAIERLLTAAGPLQQAAQARLEEIKRVFGVAARPSQVTGREGRK